MQVYNALMDLSHLLPINCGRHLWTPSVIESGVTEARLMGLHCGSQSPNDFRELGNSIRKEHNSMQEARELLHHLEQFYKEPVGVMRLAS